MKKYGILFDYFRKCPFLSGMMNIAAKSEWGNTVIIPQGASAVSEYEEKIDALGNYQCVIQPYPSIYEDFQINCYVPYDAKEEALSDTNNVLTYEQVCGVCEWIANQNESGNFPEIGEKIVSVECNPFVPQIKYIDAYTKTVGYFLTVRIRYVNRRVKKRFVEYECDC